MTTTVTRSSGPPGGTGATIEACGLTKRYGGTLAVDDLSFAVRPGVVTGFLGPNGSGKSTTMRLIMGLDAATAGDVTINGRYCHDLRWPLHEVGALLEARAIHPGRSARAHLQMLAETNSISIRRVDEVLDLVGLSDVANRRAGTFSLGMGQRLGIAAVLLGDPGVLLFDEPINGLDPDGSQRQGSIHEPRHVRSDAPVGCRSPAPPRGTHRPSCCRARTRFARRSRLKKGSQE